ncbi:MAG: hypothetical protein RLZZ136_807 [Pseudomonadota bacterium]
MHSRYLLLLASIVPIIAAQAKPAFAAEAIASPDRSITVVATGFAAPVDASGQAISVIDFAEIAAIQGPDITRVLERLPGVVFSRNGGLGGFAGVRLRGAEAEQLLVLVDGVRMDDPSQPSGGANFGNLLAGDIDKIELLRGSNSIVWGSQAIGGVMALSSRQLEGARLAAEYGAYDTVTASGALGGTAGAFSGTLGLGYIHSRGFSELVGDPEVDGFRQSEVTGKGRVDLGHGFALSANGRYADSRRAVDGFGVTSNDVQYTRDTSGRIGLTYTVPGQLELEASGALFDTRRHYDGSDLGGLFYRGRTTSAALAGRWTMRPKLALVFGGDSESTQFRDAATARKTASQSSAHALLNYSDGGLNLAAGLRFDHHNRFGGHWTYGANASLVLARHLRARVSYGEGFKSPTLYQLNAFGNDYGFLFAGNPALKPELSHSYEAGLDYGERDDTFHAAATLFRRDSTNLISFVSCDSSAVGICAAHLGDYAVGTYANIGKARADGYELEADWRPSDPLVLRAQYSFVKSFNRTSGDWYEGRDLARRPRHALTLAADWRSPLYGLSLGSDLRMVSSSYDSQFSNQKLHGYALVTLRAAAPVGHGVEIYGRVENLTDAQYQTAAGYATAGRSAYLGARARF